MAVDKLVDSTQLDSDLTSVANAIRTKGGTSAQLAFPAGFVQAIGDIQTGGTDTLLLALCRQLTGDIVLNVNPTISSSTASTFRELLADNPIDSLKVTGLTVCPERFAYQQLGAGYGHASVMKSIEMNSSSIGNEVCAYARKLTSAHFPNAYLEKVNYGWQGSRAFINCTSLTDVYIPLFPTIQEQMFLGCSALAVLDLPSVTRIRARGFESCSALETIVLRASSVAVLENTSAFAGTRFASGGVGGTIYIPETLYNHLGDSTSDDYKTATNWATIDGYGTITWAKIEGSVYDT